MEAMMRMLVNAAISETSIWSVPGLENLREAIGYEPAVEPSVKIPASVTSSSTFDGRSDEDCEEQQQLEGT